MARKCNKMRLTEWSNVEYKKKRKAKKTNILLYTFLSVCVCVCVSTLDKRL
jgi:hypothetical protein